MNQSFNNALRFLYDTVDYERMVPPKYSRKEYDLDKFTALLSLLGNPHRRIKSVLVAGTKGKGSTSAIMASILSASGYRTGLYTSPHLVSVRERITVDDRPIPEADFAGIIFDIKDKKMSDVGDYQTVFEILTAAAFIYFIKKKVDIAVFEVGLGGRLDATNVLGPLVSVITPVSFDHCDVLGNSLEKIAVEKGGIIKDAGTTVVSVQRPEAMRALRRIAERKKSKFIEAGKTFRAENVRMSAAGTRFDLRGDNVYYKNLFLPLLGVHQVDNAVTALCAVQQLRGYDISESDIRRGLKDVRWPGRIEVAGKRPWVVLDGAHNVKSAAALKTALRDIFKYEKIALVLGISANKDIDGIVKILAPAADIVFVTKAASARAADPLLILKKCSRYNKNSFIETDPVKALKRAKEAAEKNGLVCVTGSLYLVGDVKKRGSWFF